MVPLIGYVDRFSARPGERIAVKVSSQLGEPYQADLVRIVHGDPNPAGPGLKFEKVAAQFAGTYPSRFQDVHSGSCGIVVPGKPLALPDPCTIVVRVQPWLPDGREQTVLAIDGGPTLWLTAEGAGLAIGGREVRVAAPMLKRRWYELRIVAEAGRVHLRQTGLQRSWGVIDSGEAELTGALGALGIIVFGAIPDPTPGPGDNPYGSFFNGRIEDPAILTGARHAPAPLEPDEAAASRGGISAWISRASASLTEDRRRCMAACTTCRRGRFAARGGPAKRSAGGIGPGTMPRSISMKTICTIAAGTPISR